MTFLKKAACVSGSAMVLSFVLAGCGGPDNDKTMQTKTDGSPTETVTSSGPSGPSSSEDAYKAQAAQQQDLYKKGGYKKK